MATILVVDDSTSQRTQLRDILEKGKHTVIEASNGMEGLEKILKTPRIDIVITDFNMPGMDGLQMLSAAKEEMGGLKFVPFLLTTQTDESLKQSGKKIGVSAWITKPVDPTKLLNAIKTVIARRAA